MLRSRKILDSLIAWHHDGDPADANWVDPSVAKTIADTTGKALPLWEFQDKYSVRILLMDSKSMKSLSILLFLCDSSDFVSTIRRPRQTRWRTPRPVTTTFTHSFFVRRSVGVFRDGSRQMNNNVITTIEDDAFSGLGTLQRLWVSNWLLKFGLSRSRALNTATTVRHTSTTLVGSWQLRIPVCKGLFCVPGKCYVVLH